MKLKKKKNRLQDWYEKSKKTGKYYESVSKIWAQHRFHRQRDWGRAATYRGPRVVSHSVTRTTPTMRVWLSKDRKGKEEGGRNGACKATYHLGYAPVSHNVSCVYEAVEHLGGLFYQVALIGVVLQLIIYSRQTTTTTPSLHHPHNPLLHTAQRCSHIFQLAGLGGRGRVSVWIPSAARSQRAGCFSTLRQCQDWQWQPEKAWEYGSRYVFTPKPKSEKVSFLPNLRKSKPPVTTALSLLR